MLTSNEHVRGVALLDGGIGRILMEPLNQSIMRDFAPTRDRFNVSALHIFNPGQK